MTRGEAAPALRCREGSCLALRGKGQAEWNLLFRAGKVQTGAVTQPHEASPLPSPQFSGPSRKEVTAQELSEQGLSVSKAGQEDA